jgi:nitric oxide reductase NorD protein
MTNKERLGGWRARFGGGRATAVEAPVGHPPLAMRAVERTLALFVAGLTEGALVVAESAEATGCGAYTDGRTIYLPERVAHAPTRAGNLTLYKTLIAHAAAQLRYGTLAQDGGLDRLRGAADHELMVALFDIVEGARLAGRLAEEFPGVGRDLAALGQAGLAARPVLAGLRGRGQAMEAVLRQTLGAGADEVASLRGRAVEALRASLRVLPAADAWAGLTRAESIDLARALYERIVGLGAGPLPGPLPGRSRIRLDRVRAEVLLPSAPPPKQEEPERPKVPIELPRPAPTLIVEGRGLPPPLPNSEDRRVEARGGRQVAVSYADTTPQFSARLVPLTPEEKRGAFIYPEWDVTIGAYRPEWVALRPRRLRAGTTDWVERVIRRRHAQVQAIKRQFETLRPERQRLRRQDDGEDLDLDVIVESHVDRHLGLPPSERPYARTREDRRDIAVAFLIDLSGSTGGYVAGPQGGERVIDVAKESLVLLCEALTTLNDQHAIFGFSGSTRKGCEFYTVKDFPGSWDDEAKRRLGGLAPLSYTRLGPPIRHTTTLLQAIPARVKLLMLLSDGRPNDFDAYGGEYGIEDTRKALLEARGRGIRTFCLTIDAEAREYMPRLFGPDNYVTLANAATLPRKLPDLYRRLTVG